MTSGSDEGDPQDTDGKPADNQNWRNRASALCRAGWDKLRAAGHWLAASFSKPDNLPLHLTWIATAFLAGFAFEAWNEAIKGTAALEDQLKAMEADRRPWVRHKRYYC
jgi:hypothetical protein